MNDFSRSFNYCLAAALALLGIGGIGYGIGMAGGLGLEGIARQPSAAGAISEYMLLYVIIPELILACILAHVSLRIISKRKHDKDC